MTFFRALFLSRYLKENENLLSVSTVNMMGPIIFLAHRPNESSASFRLDIWDQIECQ